MSINNIVVNHLRLNWNKILRLHQIESLSLKKEKKLLYFWYIEYQFKFKGFIELNTLINSSRKK
jgi:hypothetical protein